MKKMKKILLAGLVIALTNFGLYQYTQASTITLDFTGSVSGVGEYLSINYGDYQLVPSNEEQLTSYFSGVSSFLGSITYDSNLPNTSPYTTTAWYSPANLSVSIPEIGLSGSGDSTVVVADNLNQNIIPDQFNPYTNSISAFSTDAVGGRTPMFFWFGFYGDSTMLDSNSLPTTSFTPTSGDLSFVFSENQSDRRQILLSLSDINIIASSTSPVPEPTTILLLGSGLVGFAGLRRKFKKA